MAMHCQHAAITWRGQYGGSKKGQWSPEQDSIPCQPVPGPVPSRARIGLIFQVWTVVPVRPYVRAFKHIYTRARLQLLYATTFVINNYIYIYIYAFEARPVCGVTMIGTLVPEVQSIVHVMFGGSRNSKVFHT